MAAPPAARRGRDRAPDAGRGAGDERDPTREWLRGGEAPQLCFLERPVLDTELLGFGDRFVRRHRFRAADDVDRVHVELTRDARRARVGSEAEHADTGHEHDGGVGAAHRRRVRSRVAPVVGRIFVAILRVELAQSRDEVGLGRGRRNVENERPDLGANEVVGARSALANDGFDCFRGEEIEHEIAVGEPADDPVVGGAQAADVRGERGGERTSVGRRQRGEVGTRRSERIEAPALGDEPFRARDHIERKRRASF